MLLELDLYLAAFVFLMAKFLLLQVDDPLFIMGLVAMFLSVIYSAIGWFAVRTLLGKHFVCPSMKHHWTATTPI